MTQQQLADAAGTSRSAVSNIERGSRDPAWDTVVGLVEAAGFRLDPVLSDAPTAPEGGPPPTVE